MNLRRVITLLALLLVVSVAIFIWLQDVVREVIVLPVSYLLFVAGIVIDTTPQLFFWLSLMLIAFWIAYRSLTTRRRRTLPPQVPPVVDDAFSRNALGGRVTFWDSRVTQMRRHSSIYYQGAFHHSLARLLIELLAHRYRLTPLQAEERLRSGELEVPAEIREYVLNSLSRLEPARGNIFAQIWKTIQATARRWFGGRPGESPVGGNGRPATPAEAQIARIIQYMEQELEISHDHPSQ
jgi:hypothetical protein